MLFSDAPYLSNINASPALRIAAVKLQSYAALDWRRGGTFGVDVLAPFWADYKTIANQKNGTPFDGQFLGSGVPDPRASLYKVASAVRMGGSFHDKQAFGEFLSFFEMAARSLTDKKSAVASVKVFIDDSDTQDQQLTLGNSKSIARFRLMDKDGVQVPASVDSPLLGFTQFTTTEDPTWFANYGSQHSTGAAGQSVVNEKPGRHILRATYKLTTGDVIGELTYIRLNADGSDPTEEVPPKEPAAKVANNGIAK